MATTATQFPRASFGDLYSLYLYDSSLIEQAYEGCPTIWGRLFHHGPFPQMWVSRAYACRMALAQWARQLRYAIRLSSAR